MLISMGMSDLKKLTVLLWLSCGGAFVWASPAPANSVDELVQQALSENPELLAYEALVAQARGRRQQAGKWKNPELEVEAGHRQVEELSGAKSSEQGYTLGLALTQRFEFPGKGSLRKAVANQEVHVAELSLDQFRLSLQGKVQQLALRYQTAAATAELAQQIRLRSSDLVKLLADRSLGGARPLLELRVIQADQLELAEIAKDAELARDAAWGELNVLLGRSTRNPLGSEISMPVLAPTHLSLAEVLPLVFANNLLLKIHETEIERAALSLDLERLSVAPNFEIGPFFSRDRAGEEETVIGGRLSVELPVWDQNQGNVNSAIAMKSLAQLRLLQAQQELEREVTLRWKTHLAAREQLKNFDPEMLNNLNDASALADRQYRQGAISVQLYLETQRALLQTRQVHDRAVQQLWDTWLDLNLLTGGAIANVANKKE